MLGITPILLAALAGTLSERVGLFNIALEGQMLVGAFVAVAGSHFGGSLLAGVLAAVAAGTVFSGLLAVGSGFLRGNDIVIGISLNLLAAGLTSFLLRSLFGVSGTFSDSTMAGLPRLHRSLGLVAAAAGPALSASRTRWFICLGAWSSSSQYS